MNDFHISTNQVLLNIDLVYSYLSKEAYWSKGRGKETVVKSIKNSMCFGVYDQKNVQIGFARVVTDYTIFAWLMDVFIIPEQQGKGRGKKLLEFIKSHPELSSITRWGLCTYDAQEFYKQFGFKELSHPDIHMEISTFSKDN